MAGHAFAGGLITAAVCDYRVAVADEARFGLDEVPIGIPMLAVYVRMLAYAWGEPGALRHIAELTDTLDGELPDGMTSDQARRAHRRYWQELRGSPAPW
jgi:enoyl-CoA hydratase/carnithine racemase